MSKGLEALEKLTNYKCSNMSEKIECKEIIEKELKALEVINKYFIPQHIILDLYALGGEDEEIKIVKEVLL